MSTTGNTRGASVGTGEAWEWKAGSMQNGPQRGRRESGTEGGRNGGFAEEIHFTHLGKASRALLGQNGCIFL